MDSRKDWIGNLLTRPSQPGGNLMLFSIGRYSLLLSMGAPITTKIAKCVFVLRFYSLLALHCGMWSSYMQSTRTSIVNTEIIDPIIDCKLRHDGLTNLSVWA